MHKGGMWQPLEKISYSYWLFLAGLGWEEASGRSSETATAGIPERYAKSTTRTQAAEVEKKRPV